MDIMGYQAVTVEMVLRVRKACQVHPDHVVLKETRVRRVWQVHRDHMVLKEKRVRRVWQGHLDHVVLKEKRVRKVWQVPVDHVVLKEKRDQLERSVLNKETGNSERGKRVTAVILALLR